MSNILYLNKIFTRIFDYEETSYYCYYSNYIKKNPLPLSDRLSDSRKSVSNFSGYISMKQFLVNITDQCEVLYYIILSNFSILITVYLCNR